jgi:hypothetical protein
MNPEPRLGIAFFQRAREGDQPPVGRPRGLHGDGVLEGAALVMPAPGIADPQVRRMGEATFARARVGDVTAVV